MAAAEYAAVVRDHGAVFTSIQNHDGWSRSEAHATPMAGVRSPTLPEPPACPDFPELPVQAARVRADISRHWSAAISIESMITRFEIVWLMNRKVYG